MSSSLYKDTWTLLSTYAFQLDDDKVDDVFCTLCSKIMIEPFAAECGCQFCCKCISNYLTNGVTTCPGNKSECQGYSLTMGQNVLNSYLTTRKISKLRVKCPNKVCTTVLDLDKIEEHIRVCGMYTTTCPYFSIGCIEEELIKNDIASHLKTNMCKHSDLTVDAINNLRNEVYKSISISDQSDTKIENLLKVLECKDTLIKEMKKEIEWLNDEKRKNDEDIINLRNKCEGYEISLAKLDREIQRLDANEKRNKDETDILLATKINVLSSEIKLMQFYNEDEFLWKIDNFVVEAGFKRRSGPFYRNSYKMYLRIGIDETSMGLGCYLMRGEFDDYNDWPMKGSVTLSILDQDTMEPLKEEAFSHDTFDKKDAFSKCDDDINKCCIGNDDFMLMEDMGATSPIRKYSCLIVSCRVGFE